MDADGFVTVTGRVKDIILRGGASIAPLEIDAAMMTHPGVREAAAIGVPDRIWGEEIVCYVVPDKAAAQGTTKQTTKRRRRARPSCWRSRPTVLPDFKRPRQVVFVDSLPRNDRGKVRRDDLKALWARTQWRSGFGERASVNFPIGIASPTVHSRALVAANPRLRFGEAGSGNPGLRFLAHHFPALGPRFRGDERVGGRYDIVGTVRLRLPDFPGKPTLRRPGALIFRAARVPVSRFPSPLK